MRQWLCLQYRSCRIYRCSPCTRSHSSRGSDPLQMQPETTTKETKNFTIFCHWKIISSLPCMPGSRSKDIGDPAPYTQGTIVIPQYKNEKNGKKKQTSNDIKLDTRSPRPCPNRRNRKPAHPKCRRSRALERHPPDHRSSTFATALKILLDRNMMEVLIEPVFNPLDVGELSRRSENKIALLIEK